MLDAKTTTKRYRRGEIPGQKADAQRILDEMDEQGYTRVPRASRNAPAGATRAALNRPQAQEHDTEDDEDASYQSDQRRHTRTTTRLQQQPDPRRHWHPLVWVGLTLALLVVLWLATTSGAAWVTTHISDPGTYGPTHGNIVKTVLGGGDSKAERSTIIAMNNGGQVELMILIANNPAKAHLLTGANLVMLNFPDPAGAEIQLQTGDFNGDGHQDIKVNILATSFDMPFHRYSQSTILYGDGKGGLKPPQQGG